MAKKQKDPGIDRAWLKNLQTAPLGKLYLFYGPETFRKEAALGILRQRIVEPGTEDFSLLRFEGKTISREALSEAIDAPTFLSEKKLILVRDLDVFKTEWLEPLLDRLGDDTCLLFYYDALEYKADARTKLYKKFQTLGEIASFQEASERELLEWVAARCKSRKKHISPADAQYLVFRCGRMMQNLQMEIEKLCDYVSADTITRDDIELVTIRVPEAQVFAMSDALSEGRLPEALRFLDDMEAAREDPIPTLAMITRQIRLLYGARLCLDRRLGLQDIMDVTRLRVRYPAEKLRDAAARLELQGIRQGMQLCLEADRALKSSKTDGYAILREMLVQLQLSMHKKP